VVCPRFLTPKQIIWNVVDKVATGELTNVQDISKALRGLD